MFNNYSLKATEVNSGEHSPMITEPEGNNCFSIIFRGERQELQNNGLKHKSADAIIFLAYGWRAGNLN